MPRIDAHLHVFTKASAEFPRETSDVWPAEREEPAEKLLGEMEKHKIDQAVLVQMAGTGSGRAPLSHTMPQTLSESVPRNRTYSTGPSESCRTHGGISE